MDRITIPNASAVVLRRNVLRAAEPFPDRLRLCGDWLLWMRVLSRSDVAYCARPLNYWRQDTSHSRASDAGTLEWLEGEGVLSEGAALVGLSPAETEVVLMRFLRKCWQWQRESLARRSGVEAPVSLWTRVRRRLRSLAGR